MIRKRCWIVTEVNCVTKCCSTVMTYFEVKICIILVALNPENVYVSS